MRKQTCASDLEEKVLEGGSMGGEGRGGVRGPGGEERSGLLLAWGRSTLQPLPRIPSVLGAALALPGNPSSCGPGDRRSRNYLPKELQGCFPSSVWTQPPKSAPWPARVCAGGWKGGRASWTCRLGCGSMRCGILRRRKPGLCGVESSEAQEARTSSPGSPSSRVRLRGLPKL